MPSWALIEGATQSPLKFMFSKKATKIDEIFTTDLTISGICQVDDKDFFNFCGLLRKHKLYKLEQVTNCWPALICGLEHEKKYCVLILY